MGSPLSKTSPVTSVISGIGVPSISTLNRNAALAALEVGVHACTDVTGFGLLGHLHEMTAGSGLSAQISFSQVPILHEIIELAAQGVVPGGSKRNLAFAEEFTTFDAALGSVQRLILADAQTSGGLLLAVAPERVATLARALREQAVPVVAEIGAIDADPSGRIYVAP